MSPVSEIDSCNLYTYDYKTIKLDGVIGVCYMMDIQLVKR